jgi:hypothetical protein
MKNLRTYDRRQCSFKQPGAGNTPLVLIVGSLGPTTEWAVGKRSQQLQIAKL